MATFQDYLGGINRTPTISLNLESSARNRDLQTATVTYKPNSAVAYLGAYLGSQGLGGLDQDAIAQAFASKGLLSTYQGGNLAKADKATRQAASQEVARLFQSGAIEDYALDYFRAQKNELPFDINTIGSGMTFKANPIPQTDTGLMAGVTAPLGSAERSRQLIEAANIALGKASAPSNVSGINQVSNFQMPDNSPSFGNTTNASAGTSALGTMFETLMKQQQDYQSQLKEAQKQQEKQTSSFLNKIVGSKSPSDVRSDAMSQTGINPTEYFAEEKAAIEEIGKLNEEYNAVKAAKDQQIALTNDKLGSMNFINNQIAQIERNAAPQLNRISADINSKAAVLQAKQGRFNEAQDYINQAVQDATADLKYNYDLFKTFYDINQDTISRLDDKYQSAFSQALNLANQEYARSYEEKTSIAELMIKYPTAGISINDSLGSAAAKAGRVAPAGEFKTQEIGGTLYQIEQDASGRVIGYKPIIGGSNSGGGSADVDTYAQSYLNGDIEITSIPEKNRAAVLKKANEIANTALKQSAATTPNTTTQTNGQKLMSTVSSFFSNLFN